MVQLRTALRRLLDGARIVFSLAGRRDAWRRGIRWRLALDVALTVGLSGTGYLFDSLTIYALVTLPAAWVAAAFAGEVSTAIEVDAVRRVGAELAQWCSVNLGAAIMMVTVVASGGGSLDRAAVVLAPIVVVVGSYLQAWRAGEDLATALRYRRGHRAVVRPARR